MTSRNLTLYQQTRLAVTIVIEDDTGTLAFSLLLVTGILSFFSWCNRGVATIIREFINLASDVKEAVAFTAKVLTITVVSLGYGLGLSP